MRDIRPMMRLKQAADRENNPGTFVQARPITLFKARAQTQKSVLG
jgi:hypothetical protein